MQKTLSILALGLLVVIGAGCAKQAETPENAVKPTTNNASDANPAPMASETCKIIEDSFTGSANDNFQYWSWRVEKYPIAEQYKHLESYLRGEVGEGNSSIVARLYTAADCGENQVERLMGMGIDGDLSWIEVILEFEDVPGPLKNLAKEKDLLCFTREEEGSNLYCSIGGKGYTVKDLIDFKDFSDQIIRTSEAG